MRIVSLAILLSSCGVDYSDCDFVESSLCVYTNGIGIPRSLIEATIKTTEYYFSNSSFFPTIDLEQAISDNGLTAEFRLIASRSESEKSQKLLGYYDYSDITVFTHKNSDEKATTFSKCYMRFDVLGHELLHFIADKILEKQENDDSDTPVDEAHNIPYLFAEWAFEDEDRAFNSTVEWAIAYSGIQYCKGRELPYTQYLTFE